MSFSPFLMLAQVGDLARFVYACVRSIYRYDVALKERRERDINFQLQKIQPFLIIYIIIYAHNIHMRL